MTDKPSARSDFRTDINALRAIAVTAVLFFHYKVPFFDGGFAGVDIFFVISGYLMSRIIIRGIDRGTFSFRDYFQKRLKRIVPALLFLILIVTVASFVLYFPDEFQANQKNAASSVFFLSNIFYLTNSDYFDPSSDTNLFLHTWSLSVEWQFYLIYPFILLVAGKLLKTKKQFVNAFIGATAAIFVLTLLFSRGNQSSAFYLLPTRSWEMLAGGVAFLTEDQIKTFKWKKFLALLGYVMIACCLFFLRMTMAWPGVFTLIPVVATFLIITASEQDFLLIKNPVVQRLGSISYSLYLWHWPVFVIAQYYGLGYHLTAVAVVTAVSLACAYISFRYIESARFDNTRKLAYVMSGTFATGLFFSFVSVNDIFYKQDTLRIEAFEKTHKAEIAQQFLKDTCHVSSINKYNKDRCLCIQPDKINILMVGDSHLGQLSNSLREHLAAKNINILQATASGTLPTVKNYQGDNVRVRALMDYVFKDFIPNNAEEIDGVIISGSWAGQTDLDRENILKGIKETIEYLGKHDVDALVIGQTERYTIPYPTIAARDFENNTHSVASYLEDDAVKLNNYLKENLDEAYISVINEKEIPDLSPRNEPYMKDDHHVTEYGADLIVEKLLANPAAEAFFTEEQEGDQ